MLTISVKNFGPIAEGSVDLKPLTIFVGPSNTGKSYMATAVYAVMRGFEGPHHWGYAVNRQSQGDGQRLIQWHGPSGRMLTARNGGKDAVEALVQWASRLDGNELLRGDVYWSDLTTELQNEIKHSIRLMFDSLALDVLDKVADIYGDAPRFVKTDTGREDFRIGLSRDQPRLSVSINIADGAHQSADFDLSQMPLRQPYLEAILRQTDLHSGSELGLRSSAMVFLTLLDSAMDPLYVGLPPRSYYLPAARSGTVQVYRTLTESLYRSQRVNASVLPGATAEFLADLSSLNSDMKTKRSTELLSASIDFIQQGVLQGKIDLDESAGLPFPDFAYETDTGKFTLDQTSSMVSELAPLILFLKYLVRPGDLLILEEPESHLHPAAQRQLARGIVRLVNAGVKVLITTHSDIIISQINNLLALNQASPELIEEGGFEPEDFLQEDQVGAYLFRHDQGLGGSEVVRLDIDPDTGIDEDEFADVFEDIYNESIALQRDRS